MIRFACACGQQLQIDARQVGGRVACPACGRSAVVPERDTAASSAGPWYSPQVLSPAAAEINNHNESGADRSDADGDAASESSSINRKALWSLGLGLASFCGSLFTAVPAIVLGILALAEIRRSRGRSGGATLAVTGITSGGVGMWLTVPLLVGLPLPTVQRFREAAARTRSQSNLQRMALAMQRYHDVHDTFPAAGGGPSIHPGLSWRVTLLPYLQQDDLFRQFRLDEPADSPANRALLERMPQVYAMPETDDPAGFTRYRVFVGAAAAFAVPSRTGRAERGRTVRDFTDGVGGTLLIAEAAAGVPWTRPEELAYDASGPVPRLSTVFGGTNTIFGDGSLHVLPPDVREADLRALITRNGGESVTPP